MDEEALPPVSQEVVDKVRKSLGLDEKRIKEAVEGIKEWLSMQPHLPMEQDDGRLERWLIRCKNSMEKTKKTLDLYYTLKTLTPELMYNWDVNQPWFDTMSKVSYVFAMPKLTPEMDRVIVYGYHPGDGKNFDFFDFCKAILLEAEIRMRDDYCLKEVYVVDYQNISMAHVTRITLPGMKKMELCLLGGYNARMRAVHFINVPQYANVVISIIKTVLKSKLVSRIFTYSEDLTEFYKAVPRECLPVELGGTSGTVQENWDRWLAKLKSNRDWLVSRENIKSDEMRRPIDKVNSSELFGFEGSFRKLNVD